MAIYVNGRIYQQESLEAIIRDLQSRLDAAMHKETAMCLELERERGRLDWWIGHAANLAEDGGSFSWYEDGATRFNWQVQIVIDGDIRAAIDEAMKVGAG